MIRLEPQILACFIHAIYPAGIKSNGMGRFHWWMATGGTEIMMPWDEHGGCFYEPFDDHPNPDPGKTYSTEDLPDGVMLSMVFRMPSVRYLSASFRGPGREVILPPLS